MFMSLVDKSKESMLVLAGSLMPVMLYGCSKICSTQKKKFKKIKIKKCK